MLKIDFLRFSGYIENLDKELVRLNALENQIIKSKSLTLSSITIHEIDKLINQLQEYKLALNETINVARNTETELRHTQLEVQKKIDEELSKLNRVED